MKVSVLASAFLLAVVLGNVSLRYIPVSFAQVSTSPAPSFPRSVLPCQSSDTIQCIDPHPMQGSPAHWRLWHLGLCSSRWAL